MARSRGWIFARRRPARFAKTAPTARAFLVALAATVALAAVACSHGQTVCPRGASLARRIYSGGGEAEWCRRDADSVRQGAEVRYYESGVRLLEGLYVDGVQHGTWRYYWRTGETWREESWNDGELVEQRIVNRAARPGGTANNDEVALLTSGAAKLGFAETAAHRRQMEQEARSFSERYPDGKLRALGRYDGEGARWGVWWFWYPNGQLAREVEYQGGVRHRGFREWYGDGRARTDGAYFMGRKDNRWRRWDGTGRLVEDDLFRDGARVPSRGVAGEGTGDGTVIESSP